MKLLSFAFAFLLTGAFLHADAPYTPYDTNVQNDSNYYYPNGTPSDPNDYLPSNYPYNSTPSDPTAAAGNQRDAKAAPCGSEACTPGNCPLYPSAPARGTSCSLNFLTMTIPVLIVAGVATAILVSESHTAHN